MEVKTEYLDFEPIKINIIIETKEELLDLWARAGVLRRDIPDTSIFKQHISYEATKLFDSLDSIIIKKMLW